MWNEIIENVNLDGLYEVRDEKDEDEDGEEEERE